MHVTGEAWNRAVIKIFVVTVGNVQGSGKVIVNAKGSDSQLISNLLDEVKALV